MGQDQVSEGVSVLCLLATKQLTEVDRWIHEAMKAMLRLELEKKLQAALEEVDKAL